MPNYQAYPNALNTPSRKVRKAKRRTVFAFNKAAGALQRKTRREARKTNEN